MASVLHVKNYFFTQAPSITPFTGGLIIAVILVSSAVTASPSRTHHVIGAVLAIFALGLGVDWLELTTPLWRPWTQRYLQFALNGSLLGRSNYFCHGTCRPAFRGIDRYVYERVRDFLARLHKVAGRGTKRFSCDVIYGKRRDSGKSARPVRRAGMGNGALPNGPSYRAHPRLYLLRPRSMPACLLMSAVN